MKLILLAGFAVMGIAAAAMWFVDREEGHVMAAVDNSSTGILFTEGSLSDALKKARQEQKLVFLDAYASWCGPCKLLKKRTFPDPIAGQFFNQHFVSVAIDMEKGEGPALARKFGVDAYPTLIITDTEGNPVAYTKGFMEADELIEFGRFALSRIDKREGGNE